MFKVKNDILPNVLGEFITKRNRLEFQRDEGSTTRYGTESICILRIRHIPIGIKEAETLNSFEAKIKNYKVKNCPAG